MDTIDYSIFESVEELQERFGLIVEKKGGPERDEPKKDEPKDAEKPEKKVKADKIPVVYADLNTKKYTNIFKHWIIFTNDRSDENKTLKNIHEAIKDFDMKPELHVFVAAQMDAEEDESKITIRDDKEEFVVEKESNLDTLVFSRLGVQGEDECEHVVQLLQDRGFLVLNPVKYSALACNKYESACLFEKGGIPQPNFCLIARYGWKEYLFRHSLLGLALRLLRLVWRAVGRQIVRLWGALTRVDMRDSAAVYILLRVLLSLIISSCPISTASRLILAEP